MNDYQDPNLNAAWAAKPNQNQFGSNSFPMQSQAQPQVVQEQPKGKENDAILDMSQLELQVPNPSERLRNLSKDQLQELMESGDVREELCFELTGPIRSMKEGFQDDVIRVATENLQTKEEIETLDGETAALRADVQQAMEVYMQLKQRQEKVLAKFSVDRIQEELTRLIDKTEADVQELNNKLQSQELSPLVFVRDFQKLRTDYHLLSLKKEKLMALFG